LAVRLMERNYEKHGGGPLEETGCGRGGQLTMWIGQFAPDPERYVAQTAWGGGVGPTQWPGDEKEAGDGLLL